MKAPAGESELRMRSFRGLGCRGQLLVLRIQCATTRLVADLRTETMRTMFPFRNRTESGYQSITQGKDAHDANSRLRPTRSFETATRQVPATPLAAPRISVLVDRRWSSTWRGGPP